MATSWDTLAAQHGPQIAAYNAPPDEDEPDQGGEQEYTVRVDFVARTTVTISATSREAALSEAFNETLNPFDRNLDWEVIDTSISEKP